MSQNTNSTKNQPATICRAFSCNTSLCNADPASQYIKLKLIQNTVRVPSSLYVHDLGALTTYQHPNPKYGVNWNQMSDRAVRHVQPNIVTGGSFYHGSSTKNTITRCRPGAGCPGGAGVDIKHNSYDRYLNRLKGKGPVRRGVVPPNFGASLPFNPAFPIYGGKTMKTSIVGDNCVCPIVSDNTIYNDSNAKLYNILFDPLLLNSSFTFQVGNVVYALNSQGYYERAVVSTITNDKFTVIFDNGTSTTTTADKLLVYFPCNCTKSLVDNLSINTNNGLILSTSPKVIEDCYIVNKYLGTNSVFNVIYAIKNLLPIQFQKFLSYYNT
jgi:hypothetical protein